MSRNQSGEGIADFIGFILGMIFIGICSIIGVAAVLALFLVVIAAPFIIGYAYNLPIWAVIIICAFVYPYVYMMAKNEL